MKHDTEPLFLRQKNISGHYREEFFVNMMQTPSFQQGALYVHAYGESRIEPGGETNVNMGNPHFSTYSLELIVAGAGKLIRNDREYPLVSGSFFMIPSCGSALVRASEDQGLEKKVITLERGSIASLLCNQDDMPDAAVVPLQDLERVTVIYEAVKKLCSEGHPYLQYELSSQAYRLLTEIGRQHKINPGKLSMNALIFRIIADPTANYTLNSMAELCGVNIRTLNQKFQERFGMPPVRFVILKRLEYARKLLLSESFPVKQIAEECGYRNPAFFSREFKRHFGVSPNHFLRNLPEN